MSKKTFKARGFVTGDYECFCLASDPDPKHQDRKTRVYPGDWFDHLDPDTLYEFEITVVAKRVLI